MENIIKYSTIKVHLNELLRTQPKTYSSLVTAVYTQYSKLLLVYFKVYQTVDKPPSEV